MAIAAEVVLCPASLVATALSEYCPAATLVQVKLNGALVAVPIKVAP